MPTPTVHGIPNCDSVRRARAWLADAGVAYRFHDLRRDGCAPVDVGRWAGAVGWDRLVNRRGPSFRALSEPDRMALAAEGERAAAVVAANPSIIKRPLVDWGDGTITVGFDPDLFTTRTTGAA